MFFAFLKFYISVPSFLRYCLIFYLQMRQKSEYFFYPKRFWLLKILKLPFSASKTPIFTPIFFQHATKKTQKTPPKKHFFLFFLPSSRHFSKQHTIYI